MQVSKAPRQCFHVHRNTRSVAASSLCPLGCFHSRHIPEEPKFKSQQMTIKIKWPILANECSTVSHQNLLRPISQSECNKSHQNLQQWIYINPSFVLHFVTATLLTVCIVFRALSISSIRIRTYLSLNWFRSEVARCLENSWSTRAPHRKSRG